MRGGNLIPLRDKTANNPTNAAVVEFTDPEHDARLFSTWYSAETMKYFLHSSINASRCLRYVFWDGQDDVAAFTSQLSCLITLANTLHRPAVFISKEPGNPFHWIGGIVEKNNLFLFNPAGLTKHTSFYEALASLQKGSGSLLKKVLLSTTVLQCDPSGFVSCGPLCAEWAMEVSERESCLEVLLAGFKEEANQEKEGLHYAVVDITPHLSGLLSTLNSSLSTEVYQEKLIRLRANHLEQLQSRSQIALEKDTSFSFDLTRYWESCLEAPEQQLIFRLVHPDSNDRLHFLNIEESPLYQQLQTSLQVRSRVVFPTVPPIKTYPTSAHEFVSASGQKRDAKNHYHFQLDKRYIPNLPKYHTDVESERKKATSSTLSIMKSPMPETSSSPQATEKNTHLKKSVDEIEAARSSSEILKEAEKNCVKSLQSANKLEGAEKQQALSVGFEVLGDIYDKKGDLFEKNLLKRHREKLKAVTLYNMALANEGQLLDVQKRLLQKIQQSENQLLFSCGGIPRKENAEIYWQEIQASRDILAYIRNEARIALEKVEIDSPDIQTIYQKIAFGLRESLVKKLINDCFELLPLPEGCVYSIMVLGSIAREEATPYSDFEWAILIEDQGEAKNKIHKEYFRRLTELVWIKVLNLGETTARMMDIESLSWFPENESPTKKGFSFDGQMMDGCHTPLGNKHHTEVKVAAIQNSKILTEQEKENEIQKIKLGEYELIGTPQDLADFQQNKWENKRGFCTVLSTVTVIMSNDDHLKQHLIDCYEEQMAAIWRTPIRENTNSESPNQILIQKRSLKFLSESAERFQFQGGRFDKECHYFDVKYHLYRLPNMLIDHLASYFYFKEVKAKNLWDRIEAIWGEQGVAQNPGALDHLKRTISTILTIRATAYLKKGYRDDHILMFDLSHPEENQDLLQKYLGINEKTLFQIFFVLIPLHFIIVHCIHFNNFIEILSQSVYLDSSEDILGFIYMELLNFTKAIGIFEQAKLDQTNQYKADNNSFYSKIKIVRVYSGLSGAYQDVGRYKEAIENSKEAISILSKIYGEQHLFLAATLCILAKGYCAQGNYEEAIEALKKATPIVKAKMKNDKFSLEWFLWILAILGEINYNQGKYGKAKLSLEKANKKITILSRFYGDDGLPTYVLLFLGQVNDKQYCYSEAIAIYQEIQNRFIVKYGKGHTLTSYIWNCLGNIYYNQGRYEKAIKLLEKAKHIRQLRYGDKGSPLIGDSNYNLALVFIEKKQYQVARELFQKALVIYQKFYHFRQENALLHIGLSYIREGNAFLLRKNMNFIQAKRHYETAFKCLGQQEDTDLSKPENHRLFAKFFYEKKQLRASIEHYQILIQLRSEDAFAHDMLARLLHVFAQIEKDKGEEVSYQTYLKEVQVHFEEAIRLESHTGVYAEYAQFLWKNRKFYLTDIIADYLERAISLDQMDTELTYGIIERPILDCHLQSLIDQEGKVTFTAYFLAHYLLIQVYAFRRQLQKAINILADLERLSKIEKPSSANGTLLTVAQQTVCELEQSMSSAVLSASTLKCSILPLNSFFKRNIREQYNFEQPISDTSTLEKLRLLTGEIFVGYFRRDDSYVLDALLVVSVHEIEKIEIIRNKLKELKIDSEVIIENDKRYLIIRDINKDQASTVSECFRTFQRR